MFVQKKYTAFLTDHACSAHSNYDTHNWCVRACSCHPPAPPPPESCPAKKQRGVPRCLISPTQRQHVVRARACPYPQPPNCSSRVRGASHHNHTYYCTLHLLFPRTRTLQGGRERQGACLALLFRPVCGLTTLLRWGLVSSFLVRPPSSECKARANYMKNITCRTHDPPPLCALFIRRAYVSRPATTFLWWCDTPSHPKKTKNGNPAETHQMRGDTREDGTGGFCETCCVRARQACGE